MKKIVLLALIFLIRLVSLSHAGDIATLNINGHDYWLNGINLPWIRWEDFDDPWGSNNYNHDKFDAAFKKYQENGINSVRVWIHCKGEGSPVLDATGKVIGTSDVFWDNFTDMLDLAKKYNLFIMPALFSFDIVDTKRTITKYTDNSAENFIKFVNSQENVQSYIDNFLIEFINRYDTNSAMFCYEICNEPEWMSENSGLDKNNIIRMHAQIASAIHKYGNKPVTTGSASLKWTGQQYDYWSDEVLQAQYNDPGAYFDFYQIHYYDWMDPDGTDPYKFSPFTQTVASLSSKLKGRPVIVGELPGDGGQYHTIKEAYELIMQNGYAGAFGWSDFANDGHGTFDEIQVATNYMYTTYKDAIEPVAPTTVVNITNSKKETISIYPNPFNPTTTITINALKNSGNVKVYDVAGNLIKSFSINKAGINNIVFNGNRLSSGVYFVKYINGTNSISRKMILMK